MREWARTFWLLWMIASATASIAAEADQWIAHPGVWESTMSVLDESGKPSEQLPKKVCVEATGNDLSKVFNSPYSTACHSVTSETADDHVIEKDCKLSPPTYSSVVIRNIAKTDDGTGTLDKIESRTKFPNGRIFIWSMHWVAANCGDEDRLHIPAQGQSGK